MATAAILFAGAASAQNLVPSVSIGGSAGTTGDVSAVFGGQHGSSGGSTLGTSNMVLRGNVSGLCPSGPCQGKGGSLVANTAQSGVGGAVGKTHSGETAAEALMNQNGGSTIGASWPTGNYTVGIALNGSGTALGAFGGQHGAATAKTSGTNTLEGNLVLDGLCKSCSQQAASARGLVTQNASSMAFGVSGHALAPAMAQNSTSAAAALAAGINSAPPTP